LIEKGYSVTGYYFDVTGMKKDYNDAKNVADKLGIDIIFEDLTSEFNSIVVSNFTNEYMVGHTPNPCIICNPLIKFKHLIEKADEIGAYYIATGHYAKIINYKDHYYIGISDNDKKDQSYMLYRLSEDIIKRIIFPLEGILDKDDTRMLAKENGLQNAEKKDSQEICFVPSDSNYIEYLNNKGYSTEEGNFVDLNGNILGQHKGIMNYTIGQRKGLGIALGKPAFVVKIDSDKNEVVLGDNTDLFSDEVLCNNYVLNGLDDKELDGLEVLAKVRYSARPQKAVLSLDNNIIKAKFEEPQRAITPGQSIVFYINNKVIGGGFICG